MVKNPPPSGRRLKRLRFDPCAGKIPWRRAWQPTPVFLPGQSHRQRAPQACYKLVKIRSTGSRIQPGPESVFGEVTCG